MLPAKYSYLGVWNANGTYHFGVPNDVDNTKEFITRFMLNDEAVILERGAKGEEFMSWSPDGKKIALSTNTGSGVNTDEIWILDIDRFLTTRPSKVPVKVMTIPAGYRTFNPYAEFISNSTLAISMAKKGSDHCVFWEVDLQGKVLRQITSRP